MNEWIYLFVNNSHFVKGLKMDTVVLSFDHPKARKLSASGGPWSPPGAGPLAHAGGSDPRRSDPGVGSHCAPSPCVRDLAPNWKIQAPPLTVCLPCSPLMSKCLCMVHQSFTRWETAACFLLSPQLQKLDDWWRDYCVDWTCCCCTRVTITTIYRPNSRTTVGYWTSSTDYNSSECSSKRVSVIASFA